MVNNQQRQQQEVTTAAAAAAAKNVPNGMIGNLLKSDYIKARIVEIKENDELKNQMDIRVSDRHRQNVLEMAAYIEKVLVEAGSPFLVNQICSMIIKIFEQSSLEKHVTLIFNTLPDRYKDKKKDHFKTQQSRVYSSVIKRGFTNINNIDLSLIDSNQLRELRNLSFSLPDSIEKELISRNEPVTINVTQDGGGDGGYIGGGNPQTQQGTYSELSDLKSLEDNKFKKACLGAAIATPEQLCRDPEYGKLFVLLKKVMDQAVKGQEIMRDWFTKQYPPLTIDHCQKLIKAYTYWNELMRPYFDRKYRRDHIQSLKTSFVRARQTATKAAHESAIPCAHHVDKNGNPIMRSLTKEQIDAIYHWEINFMQELSNQYYWWMELITEVNEAHGCRVGEDRAVDLSGALSHKS